VTHRIHRHAAVRRDIVDLADWIARDSHEIAFRFIEQAEATIASLAEMPGKGGPKHLRHRALKNVRTCAVKEFPKHLILYEIRGGDVFVFAVVHGARRYSQLLRDRAK
jgi:plasmid stabilization system protein ParE